MFTRIAVGFVWTRYRPRPGGMTATAWRGTKGSSSAEENSGPVADSDLILTEGCTRAMFFGWILGATGVSSNPSAFGIGSLTRVEDNPVAPRTSTPVVCCIRPTHADFPH